MQIKQQPEDFLVKEIAHHTLEEGRHLLCMVEKRQRATEEVAQALAHFLNIPRRRIGYAGTKDVQAITTQYFSIEFPDKARVEQFALSGTKIRVLGTIREPLSLGKLDGNAFSITVRGLEKPLASIARVPNYYGEQRFGTDNAEIGRMMVVKNWPAAVEKIGASDSVWQERLNNYLSERKNDYVGALKLMPRHQLLMYVHAYQSKLWNEVLEQYAQTSQEDTIIPIIGFATELEEPFASWYAALLQRDGVTQRDFVIKEIPWLTSEGTERQAFVPVEHFALGEYRDGVQTVTFSLPKGSYATVVVERVAQ